MKILTTGRRKLDQSDLEWIRLPEKLWRVKLDQIQDARMRATMANYLSRFDEMAEKGAGLVLLGDVGVGKSSAAALVAKEARARGYTTVWMPVTELRAHLRNRTDFENGIPWLERCRQVDVLVLDHFYEDRFDQMFGMQAMSDLLTSRGQRTRITVLTMPMSMEQYANFDLRQSIASFMVPLEMHGVNRHEIEGELLTNLVTGEKS